MWMLRKWRERWRLELVERSGRGEPGWTRGGGGERGKVRGRERSGRRREGVHKTVEFGWRTDRQEKKKE